MVVNRDQMMNGWIKFAECEMAKGRNDIAGRWGIPLLAGMFFNSIWNRMVEPNMDMVRSLGYMDESGCIDIDRLHGEISGVARRMGKAVQGFPVIGEYAFSDQDVDKLYQYIITS